MAAWCGYMLVLLEFYALYDAHFKSNGGQSVERYYSSISFEKKNAD